MFLSSTRTMQSTFIIYWQLRLCSDNTVCRRVHVSVCVGMMSTCDSMIQMRGRYVLWAQVYDCVISSLCMQILNEDGQRERARIKDRGRGRERGRGGREGVDVVQEMDRVRRGEGERWCDDRAAGAVCTCICRQINHKIASYSIKMVM